MRRRVLLVALWLAGTAGATALVFGFLARLSTDSGTVSQLDTERRRSGPSTAEVTVVTPSPAVTTVTPTSEASTTVPPTTTELSVTAQSTVPPEGTVNAPPGVGPVTTVRRPTVTTPSPSQTPPPATTAAAPATTASPPPTAPPTTTPTPTTVATTPPSVPSGAECSTGIEAVGRSVVTYRVCRYDVYFVGAQPAPGWSFAVVAYGPPVVSVRFSSSSSTLTCTISVDGDGIKQTLGDC